MKQVSLPSTLIILGTVCVLCLAGFIAIAVASIAYPYDLEMYEGTIFVPALRLVAGEPIFGREVVLKPPYVFAAYGPLYYALVGVVLHVIGLAYWPGRLLSALATVGTCALIYLAVIKARHDCISGLVGSTLFVSMPVAWSFGALQRVDALATFWAVSAVYVVLVRPYQSWAACLAGVFAALAFLTKQSAVAAVCAVIGWYLWSRQNRSLAWLVAGLAPALSTGMLFLIGSGNTGYLYNQALIAQNPLLIQNSIANTRSILQNPAVLVSLAFATLAAWRCLLEGEIRGRLPVLYVVCAGVLGVLTAAKVGSSINYFSELTAALALCTGLEIQWWLAESKGERRLAAAVLSTALVITLLAVNVGAYRGRLLIPAAKVSLYERIAEELGQDVLRDQPVAAEYPDVVLRSGHRLFFNDLFIYQAGPAEVQAVFKEALARGTLGALVTVGRWDVPGYVRVDAVGYSNPQWAVTRHYEGPFLYVREDLFRQLDRRQ